MRFRKRLINWFTHCQFFIVLAALFLVAPASHAQIATHKTVQKKVSTSPSTDTSGEQLKPLAPEPVSVAPVPPKTPAPISAAVDTMQPFLKTINFDIPAGTTQGNIPITIPDGKRLVIEYVSVRAQGPTGQKFIAQIQTNVAHTESLRGKIWLVFFYQGTFSGIDVFTASQPMHVYAEPSTPPALFVATRTDITGSAFIEATISGYIVTMRR